MISAGPRVGSRCPRTHHAAALQVNVPLGRLDSLWSRVGRVGVASVSLRASVKSGLPRVRGANPAREDILGFAGYGRGVEPRAPGRTTRARVSPRGGWPAHLLSRANVRRHAVPVERRETRCCARSFLSQPQKLRAKSRVDPDAPVSVSFPSSALTSFFGGTSTQSRAPAALSPWVSWTCSRRRTRRRWSGSGSPSSARRCAAWTGKSEASLPASRNVS